MDRALGTSYVGAFAAALLGAGAIVAASCSRDGSDEVARDSGADVARITTRDSGAVGTLDAAVDDTPYYNADGWVGIQGFDHSCGIYVAPGPTAKNYPPPIAWGPCDARLGFDGDAGSAPSDAGALSCRQMVDNWDSGIDPASGEMPFGYVSSAYVDHATQRVFLPVDRGSPTGAFSLIAEADGPVDQAMRWTSKYCGFGESTSLTDTSSIYTLVEFTSDGNLDLVRAGALGGPLGHPIVLRSYEPAITEPGYVAGANEFAEYGAGFDTGAWTDGHKLESLTANGSGQLAELRFQGDDLFFAVDDLNYGRIELHHAGTTVDFISFGNDPNHYAADLGTDGTDMVWSEATGHPGGNTSPWTTIDIMTAPYTTSPSAVSKRRLRSEIRNIGDVPFVVGCGYAAHEISTTDFAAVRLVRISDGRSWIFYDSRSPVVTWDAPLAITCSELFVDFNFGSTAQNVARIRLDSLGAGIPAD